MIHSIHIRETNVFAVSGERTVLVDTGVPGSEKAIIRELENAGIAAGNISLILITHGHTDHFGSLAALKFFVGAPVAVHTADSQCLRDGTNPAVRIATHVNPLIKAFIDDRAGIPVVPCNPDIVFNDDFSLVSYGVDASVVSTPGHTPGSVSVVFSSGEAIVGDLMMGRLVNPLQPRWPFFADDIEEVKRSVRKLLDRGVTVWYASHGGPFTRKNIEKLLAGAGS